MPIRREIIGTAASVNPRQRLQTIRDAYSKLGTGLGNMVAQAEGKAPQTKHDLYDVYSSLFQVMDHLDKYRVEFPNSFAARFSDKELSELDESLQELGTEELKPLKEIIYEGTPEMKKDLRKALAQTDAELLETFKAVGEEIFEAMPPHDYEALADGLAKDLGFQPDPAERAELIKMFKEVGDLFEADLSVIKGSPAKLDGIGAVVDLADQWSKALTLMDNLKAQLTAGASS